MFQFSGFASRSLGIPRLQRGGLPHSDTRGSMGMCPSPRIFAACRVSSLFLRYRQTDGISSTGCSSLRKELYDPKAFVTHAAWLRQAFAHCAIFPTAAIRRCLDRISVPVWPINLSVRLPIEALVGHYLTN